MIEPRSREGVLRQDFGAVRLDVLDCLRALAGLLQDKPDPRGRPVEADDIQLNALLLCCRGEGTPPVAECLVLGELDELVPLSGVEDPEVLHP